MQVEGHFKLRIPTKLSRNRPFAAAQNDIFGRFNGLNMHIITLLPRLLLLLNLIAFGLIFYELPELLAEFEKPRDVDDVALDVLGRVGHWGHGEDQ